MNREVVTGRFFLINTLSTWDQVTPPVQCPASGHFYLTRDAGRLCTPSGVRHPGKSSGRRLVTHSSFFTTPHSL